MNLDRLQLNHYLRSSIVLLIDCIVSIAASSLVLVLFIGLNGGAEAEEKFVAAWLLGALGASLLGFYATKSYRAVIRYSTLREGGLIGVATLAKELLLIITLLLANRGEESLGRLFAMIGVDFLMTFSLLMLVRVSMVGVYHLFLRAKARENAVNTVLVYGASEKSISTVLRLQHSPHYKVKGYLVKQGHVSDQNLRGLPVYHFSNNEDFMLLVRKLHLNGLLFAYREDAKKELDGLIDFCVKKGLKVFTTPSIDEVTDGKLDNTGIRKIKIEDLLGRSEIKISMDEIRRNCEGKTVMVTGAAGSIGSELCRQLAQLGVGKLVMFDNAETPLHNVRLEFEDKYPTLDFVPIIGDVRSPRRLDFIFEKYHPQVVFHAAAYKHVPLMEENPCEAVLVNVGGSKNVADKCVEYGVELMVMVSTDKAVNPTNIMGCTKRLAEIYVQSLGLSVEKGDVKGSTTFVTTRFGNVLGSNGSVIPRFKEQIEKGGPLTVTDPEIRRFFMTIPEACRLVLEAATMATGTQIFVFDMGTPIKISDLASRMIQLAGYEVGKDIKIEYTGLRPGEKLYEEVLATKENALPTDHDRIFVAKVRDYDYDEAVAVMHQLCDFAADVDIPSMVRKMKQTVPEFKSKHSEFEVYDAEIAEKQ